MAGWLAAPGRVWHRARAIRAGGRAITEVFWRMIYLGFYVQVGDLVEGASESERYVRRVGRKRQTGQIISSSKKTLPPRSSHL